MKLVQELLDELEGIEGLFATIPRVVMAEQDSPMLARHAEHIRSEGYIPPTSTRLCVPKAVHSYTFQQSDHPLPLSCSIARMQHAYGSVYL